MHADTAIMHAATAIMHADTANQYSTTFIETVTTVHFVWNHAQLLTRTVVYTTVAYFEVVCAEMHCLRQSLCTRMHALTVRSVSRNITILRHTHVSCVLN
jgi:hypothetical protein